MVLAVLLISNLIQINEKEVKLTNNSTVKPKTVAFPKNEDYEYCNIDAIINEIELLRCVNIIVKVIHIEDATYKILNVQVVTYKNKKKLRSTRLTKIEVCTDAKQIPEINCKNKS